MLLAMEGIGVGAMGLGLGSIYATGASRRIVGPAAALAIVGAGLFVASWASDLWGTARGAGGDHDAGDPHGPHHPHDGDLSTPSPETARPALDTAAGYRFVHDPVFSYRSFFVNSVDLRAGALRIRPEGWFSLDHANERLRLLVAWRAFGPRAATFDGRAPSRAKDATFVDLELTAGHHAFPPERFRITAVELTATARLDLARMHRTLRGTFAEASLGYGLLRHAYDVAGYDDDTSDQLLARWAWGAYFGRTNRGTGVGPAAGGISGEASFFYDHRHDGYAGGLLAPGLFSGVLGSFGARALAYFTDELGALAEVQAGSAWVVGASILVRQPVRP